MCRKGLRLYKLHLNFILRYYIDMFEKNPSQDIFIEKPAQRLLDLSLGALLPPREQPLKPDTLMNR